MAVVLKQIIKGSLASGSVHTDAPGTGKVQLVKNIRLVNKHATVSTTVNVSAGASGSERLVSPQNLSLAPGQLYQDDGEFVLTSTDWVLIAMSGGGPVDYLVSGIEREQS